MTRHKVIVNPTAGRGSGERAFPEIERALHDRGVEADLCRTEAPWHAVELAQQAVKDGFEVVVAVGGDGTANEVLNGLMLAQSAGLGTAAMGVLTVGRGNDFAFGAGLPLALEEGCQALAQGDRSAIDVGRVTGGQYPQGRYFGNGVGIGFDAVVGFEALKMTHLHGFVSYLVAALKTIFLYYQAPLVRIRYDDGEMTLPALMVSTMNGRRMGGGFMMAPEGQVDDGWFDLCIARQVSRAAIFALIPRFMKGTQANHPAITSVRARRVEVSALQGVLPAHGDGETLCVDGQQLVMEIFPRAIQMIRPREATTR